NFYLERLSADDRQVCVGHPSSALATGPPIALARWGPLLGHLLPPGPWPDARGEGQRPCAGCRRVLPKHPWKKFRGVGWRRPGSVSLRELEVVDGWVWRSPGSLSCNDGRLVRRTAGLRPADLMSAALAGDAASA